MVKSLDQQESKADISLSSNSHRTRDWRVKVYVVVQQNNLAAQGEPNLNIISAKLTRTAAEAIVDKMPGTSIIKLVADKG